MDHSDELVFLVRDYECDLAGMVNNASYMHYIEHARHELLRSKGVNFAQLTQQGIFLVVTRAELDFLHSLRSGDRFVVITNVERVSRLRLGFNQEIFKLPDRKPVLKARVFGTAVDREGNPKLPNVFTKILSE
jgi:acyl-CoA thioester hydrolase